MRRTTIDTALRTALVLASAGLLLFPIYWMLVTAVLPSEKVLTMSPSLLPAAADMSLDAFAGVVDRKPVLAWFVNSGLVTVGSVAVSVVISALAGYSLSRFNLGGEQIMGYALLVSRMLPGTLLVIPLYIMFSRVGMINSFAALILANIVSIVPFSTWMMKGFYDGIPAELEEAASIDGCSWFMAFRRVVLPLTLPGLAAVSIYSAILSWNEYVFARTLVMDQGKWMFTVGLASFVGEHSVDWSSLMAAGIIFIVPILIFFFILEPFLVKGMTQGSVKG